MQPFKKRTYKVTQEEYDIKEKKSRIAHLILDEKDFAPLREYFDNAQKSAEDMILNNTIREVVQEGLISGIKTMFHISKKEQVEELSGKYQMVRDFKATLNLWVMDYEQLKLEVEEKRVEVTS